MICAPVLGPSMHVCTRQMLTASEPVHVSSRSSAIRAGHSRSGDTAAAAAAAGKPAEPACARAAQTAEVSLHAHGSGLSATEFTVTQLVRQMRKYAAIRAMHGTLHSSYL